MARVLSALVLLPLIVGAVIYAPGWLFALLVGSVGLIALWEFFTIARSLNMPCYEGMGYIGAALIQLSLYLNPSALLPPLTVILLMSSLLIALISKRDFAQALTSLSATFFGMFYTALLLGLLIPIHTGFIGREHIQGFYYVFLPLVVTWAGDTGAYYVGRRFGRHKLAPRISPNKTIEGAIGGLAAGGLAGLIYRYYFLIHEPIFAMFLLSAMIAAMGQCGDAAESLLKRAAGLKDSSMLIPGHGGVLDRIDSLLFAIPVTYLYLQLQS